MKGNTGDELMTLLERRLDNVVFRLGRAATRLVVAGEEEPPRGSGLRLYDPAIFAGRMTAMAGAQLLRELPVVPEDATALWVQLYLKIEETEKALKSASGFIRHELRSRVDIRQIPELRFVYDKSIEYGKRIEEKLKEIKED